MSGIPSDADEGVIENMRENPYRSNPTPEVQELQEYLQSIADDAAIYGYDSQRVAARIKGAMALLAAEVESAYNKGKNETDDM